MAQSSIQTRLFTLGITYASRCLQVRDRLRDLANDPVEVPQAEQAETRSLTIASGDNALDAVLFRPKESAAKCALLINHGIGETVGCWRTVQEILSAEGIASLVFDYAGYGRSSGIVTATNCERDAIAAFGVLRAAVPNVPVALLGFSLGTGVACSVLDRLPVSRLILCSAFSSFREAARRLGVPQWMTPALWDNEAALRMCRVPVLILHGGSDHLFPPSMAHRLCAACPVSAKIAIFPGMAHGDPFLRPSVLYWQLVAEMLRKDAGVMPTMMEA